MLPILAQMLRSRWLATAIHLGLWLLLYLALAGLGGRVPTFGERATRTVVTVGLLPGKSLDRLFSPGELPAAAAMTNAPSAFFTRHFIKEAAPAPPPPTTRKIELTYQGFWQTAEGPQTTIVKLGDTFLFTPVGGRVTANLYVGMATMQELTLTNPAAQTNLMPLDVKKEIEVPIQ